MKNENSTARRERMQAERIEEDKRLADAAATEAAERTEEDRRAVEADQAEQAEQAERDRVAAEEKAREEALLDANDKDARAAEADQAERDKERHSALTLWELHAKNRDAPPFHFTGVAHRFVGAAYSEDEARRIAASYAGDHGAAWLDPEQTSCEELKPTEPGLIAQDLGA